MLHTLKIPLIILVLLAAIVSMECTVIDHPERPGCHTATIASFNPLALPQDTSAREPFLDPQALFSDDVYMVRPFIEDGGSVIDAEFPGGQRAMVSYLKPNVLQHIAPGIGWLTPPIVHFTVNALGVPTNVELVESSGNEALDRALIQIFKDMPRWEPASNAKGQAATQAFEFTVGNGGC